MKKHRFIAYLVLIYLCISICLVCIDCFIIRRLHPECYVTTGMAYEEVILLIGEPSRDIGSGRYIPQWDFPSGEKLTVFVDPINTQLLVTDYEFTNSYTLSVVRYIVPICIALTGLVEIGVFLCWKRKR